MWTYDKFLEYPVKIKNPNPEMSKIIITQYGGPDGELGASLRYLSQRFPMITPQAIATYEYPINMADDPDVIEPLKFLREKEIVHYQRFCEALRIVQDHLQEPHLFIMNKPEFMK